MNQEYGRRQNRGPSIHKPAEKKEHQYCIRDVQCNINDVISDRISAGDDVIQIKAEESGLSKMKWIKKVSPLRRVRDVRVVHDENVVKMKWIVEGRSKKQQPGKNQSGRDFHSVWIIVTEHHWSVLYFRFPII